MSKEISVHRAITLQISVRVSQHEAGVLFKHLADNGDDFSIEGFAVPVGVVERAKWLLDCELKRRKLPTISPMLGDATWALLLDLFIRDAEHKLTIVSCATIGTGMAPTTALRHLEMLTKQGYVQRKPHPDDERMVLVSLTGDGRSHLIELLAALS